MIDAVFYFLISALVVGLLTLAMVPVVHRRAVRLTMRRIDSMAPRSLSEIQAQQDQARAEFAMSMRQLEIKLEGLKNKSIEQLTELARRDNLIGKLKKQDRRAKRCHRGARGAAKGDTRPIAGLRRRAGDQVQFPHPRATGPCRAEEQTRRKSAVRSRRARDPGCHGRSGRHSGEDRSDLGARGSGERTFAQS